LLGLGEWTMNDTTVDELPFVFNWEREFPRIDAALQTTNNAYLFKQRRGRLVLGLRWLDPDAVQPDEQSREVVVGGERYGRYWFTDFNGQRQPIQAEDILHFYIPGRSGIASDSTAGRATQNAAAIMAGVGDTFAAFYGNNALPVMLIHVQPGTSEGDIKEVRNRFWRLFNPKRRGATENRVMAVPNTTTVTPITIDPNKLDIGTVSDWQIKAIALAHDVPYEMLMGSANYATAQDTRRGFVATIGQRIEDIGGVLGDDPDFKRYRLEYHPHTERHYSMKRDEKDASGSVLQYVSAGMQPWAAAWLLGIDAQTFPDEIARMGIWRELSQPTPALTMPLVGAGTPVEDDEGKEFEEELKRFRRWYKKRIGADVDLFESAKLAKSAKLMVADEVLRMSWETYP
jgi:hypothetical protein